MKAKSAINKGKRYENFLCQEIEGAGLGKARREAGSGSGKYKGDISCNLDYLIEAKNQATIKILDWIEQAKHQAEIGNWDRDKWCLIFRNPKKPEFEENFAVIDLNEFLKLLKKNKEPMIKEPDNILKYRLNTLGHYCKRAETDPSKWNLSNLKVAIKEVLSYVKY
jgi:hypothetical protein